MKINLKTRKQSHISKVRDHIFYQHMKMTRETKGIDELKGKELNQKVKELQSISRRMKEYQKYLNLLLF